MHATKGKLRIRGKPMTTTKWTEEVTQKRLIKAYKKELPMSDEKFTQISEKLHIGIEQAESVFIHFDHIQGESEIDRNQIFSNLLKAAVYLGLNLEKIDFHRKDA
ncbi:MAG: hypothetical protein Q7U31_03100 [Anaerolineaceae bacterium]|nr:hypothetical protein [Anaerolineaceae bacterium]